MNVLNEYNAFTINSLNGCAFPFSVKIEESKNIYRLHLYPIQIKDFTDLIIKYSNDFLVISNFDNYWLKNEFDIYSLTEIALEQGMIFNRFDNEIIGFENIEISKLFSDGLSHYNFVCFDLSGSPMLEEVEEKFLLFDDYIWNEPEFLLDKVNSTNIYINSHDDCYLFVETTDRKFVNNIIRRNMEIYVFTILQTNKKNNINISRFSDNLLQEVLSDTNEFSILQENTLFNESKLTTPSSNTPYKFGEEFDYPISGRVIYDYDESTWRVEK